MPITHDQVVTMKNNMQQQIVQAITAVNNTNTLTAEAEHAVLAAPGHIQIRSCTWGVFFHNVSATFRFPSKSNADIITSNADSNFILSDTLRETG